MMHSDRLLPPAQSTVTNNLQTPPSFEVDDEDEPSLSHELTKLIKLLQGTLSGSANTSQSGAGNPLFKRDRGVYEEYSARRSERLKRKRDESGVEKQTPSKQCVGVRMESAKRTVEVKKYESARKMTTPLVERREVATAQSVERREPVTTQRYSLRSSSKGYEL
ncbi:hypothetical protein CTI12_AA039420 [Artemisia annua]|uniref:Uncharacterized protein n=1 Tax=Artemisia annua TaxID=35608 RepID=A0A2U1QEE6_ARTAN|nr:hypothetical protein CTI12_AA039420 [Artemisia annua]